MKKAIRIRSYSAGERLQILELIKMLIAWAADLDGRFVELKEKIAAAAQAFSGAERELQARMHDIAGGVLSIDNYDHVTDRAYLTLHGSVSRAKALAMAEALAAAQKHQGRTHL